MRRVSRGHWQYYRLASEVFTQMGGYVNAHLTCEAPVTIDDVLALLQ